MKLNTIGELLRAIADYEDGKGPHVEYKHCDWADYDNTSAIALIQTAYSAFHDYEWRTVDPEQKPVPPGDLTFDEAVAAVKSGKIVEKFVGDGEWMTSAMCGAKVPEGVGCSLLAYRIKPATKMVPLN